MVFRGLVSAQSIGDNPASCLEESRMTIVVADRGLLGLAEMAPRTWQIRAYDTRVIPDALLENADALLVRSTVRLDVDRLPNSVRWIGTATIGTDHLPLDALVARGIAVASAPGCNALAVTDYVLSTVFAWAEAQDRDWRGLTVAVIGVGAVGSRLVTRLQQLGVRVFCSDAPRADHGTLADHVPLADALTQADVVSIHVPLTDGGPYPTRGLLTDALLARCPAESLLINAARGPVISEETLINSHCDLALDVFPDEPVISDLLLQRAWRVSPHIAGHSVEGKVRGTQQVVRALCEALQVPLPSFDFEVFCDRLAPRSTESSIMARIQISCPLDETDRALRDACIGRTEEVRAHAFDQVRARYRLRRESVIDF
jgi:erythronate-4-phosphate dehydrogenase